MEAFSRDELARVCDDLLARGGGRREIEVDERDRLAEEEAREIARREESVRSRKRDLRDLNEGDDAESTSEGEEDRQSALLAMDREIEALADGVRVPIGGSPSIEIDIRSDPPTFEIVEPPPEASRFAMWESTFSERSDRISAERANLCAIYPGYLDKRTAAVKALIASSGPRPSLGMRPRVEMARSSLMLFTREMEDDLLRTPVAGERPCREGFECQLYKYHGRVARECLSLSELTEFERSGVLPLKLRPCLGCMRYSVTWFWMWLRWRGDVVSTAFISTHYNLANARGEYLLEQTLLSSTRGLPLPVVPWMPGTLRPEISRDPDSGAEISVRFLQVGMVALDADSGFP